MIENETAVNAPRAHNRFKDAPWYGPQFITVIGQGGIGSWLSVLLARAGHRLITYDFDKVEDHNLGGQLFGRQDIGKFKTEAVSRMIKELADSTTEMSFGKFVPDSMTEAITFVGPDNITTRKVAFEKWYSDWSDDFGKADGPMPIFIDGRLEAETLQIFCVHDEETATKYLKDAIFDEGDVADAACTFRATSHNAAIIAGLMVSVLNNAVTNHRAQANYRDVPFQISLELPTLTFEAK